MLSKSSPIRLYTGQTVCKSFKIYFVNIEIERNYDIGREVGNGARMQMTAKSREKWTIICKG